MSNNAIFYTQIGSILTFVILVFVLYRLLVNQKDATIELLKEKAGFLESQLTQAKENSPDVLVENLSKRVTLMAEEISRLSKEKESGEQKLKRIEKANQINHEVDDIHQSVLATSSKLDELARGVAAIKAEVNAIVFDENDLEGLS